MKKMVKNNRLRCLINKKIHFLGRMFATEMCSQPITGWTEAIALDKFLDEPIYVTICQGMNIIEFE
jgi:hypothetical protein